MCSTRMSVSFAIAMMCAVVAPALHAGAEEGRTKSQACAACHGADGNSTDPQYPNLAGQTSRYLYLQLKDFKEGRRKNPIMSPMAAPLSREDMRDLADFYAGQPRTPVRFEADAARVTRGRATAEAALCSMCHLGGLSGQNEVPRVSSQHPEYVLKQLRDFKSRARTNDAGNMAAVVRGLSDEDLIDLAHYVSTLN